MGDWLKYNGNMYVKEFKLSKKNYLLQHKVNMVCSQDTNKGNLSWELSIKDEQVECMVIADK